MRPELRAQLIQTSDPQNQGMTNASCFKLLCLWSFMQQLKKSTIMDVQHFTVYEHAGLVINESDTGSASGL